MNWNNLLEQVAQPRKQPLHKGKLDVNYGDENLLATSTEERNKSNVKANKKVVLKLDLHDDKGRRKAMQIGSSLSGVDSVVMDTKDDKLTVVGDVDPDIVVSKFRKFCRTQILTVGPAKEPEKLKDEGKKDEGKKEDEKKKQIAELVYNPHMSYYQTDEDRDGLSSSSISNHPSSQPGTQPLDKSKFDDQSDSSSSRWTILDFLSEEEKEMYEKIALNDEEWDVTEIHLMDNNLSELPESPNCPVLLRLFLQRNYDLTEIPSSFFDHMPVLQVLDLSYTSIRNLPQSLSQLVALRKLLLRGCELFMDLPPQVGELKNLEELDLDKTEIMHLPTEIGNLNNLKILKVSFYGYVKYCSKNSVQLNEKIPPGAISNLSQLTQLSIDVNPDDEQWDKVVEVVIKEVSRLKMLKTLNLYMPEAKLLDKLRWDSTSLIYPSLSHFRFVVGRHKQRIIVRVPLEVEAEFNKWDKCLKFVNGDNIPDTIPDILSQATAFFVDRHMTVTKLSEFGNKNLKKLKFCLLAECNAMQTIIDGEEFYVKGSDGRDDYNDGYECNSDFEEESVLESLQYLNIYYMRDLVSIWQGPIRGSCLSCLKFLELHTCPQLSTIFTPDLLFNLINLEELIVEDCPRVNSLVSHASCHFLPKLKRMSLLYLPELVSISCGLNIAPQLERIGFYNCPKLISLSMKEMISKNLKVIQGENKWWEALEWDKSEWGGRPKHLDLIFSPINKEEDVMSQLAKDEDLLQASKQE